MVAIDSCKQNWFSISCILEEVVVFVKESRQSICRAILRSNDAGCYHCGALLSAINSTSRGSGIEVLHYDFSDPQSAKNLCHRKIAPRNNAFGIILLKITTWKVQKTQREAWSPHQELQERALQNARLTNQ